jgi:hypothetical protein
MSSYDGTGEFEEQDLEGRMSNFEEQDLEGRMSDFTENPSFVPELNFDDMDGDDNQFDNFLTKRSRARRKLRKKLRKSGKSRKDARREAKKSIPKQKLGALLKNVIKGKTSDETQKLISNAKSGTPPPVTPPPISEEIQQSSGDAGGNSGVEMDANGNPIQAGFMAKNKTMLIVAGVGVAVIGGYFAFGKSLGIR